MTSSVDKRRLLSGDVVVTRRMRRLSLWVWELPRCVGRTWSQFTLGDDELGRAPSPNRVDQREAVCLLYVHSGERSLIQCPVSQQRLPLGAGEKPAFEGWSPPAPIEFRCDVGARRLGDLAARVHEEHVVGIGVPCTCVVVALSQLGLVE